eukprot:10930208-Alexandrium_andersonii.AAC.1
MKRCSVFLAVLSAPAESTALRLLPARRQESGGVLRAVLKGVEAFSEGCFACSGLPTELRE